MARKPSKVLESSLKPRKVHHTPAKNKSGSQQPLRMARVSGEPIYPEHITLYKADFARVYDAVQAKLGKTDVSIWTAAESERANKLLQRCERIIRARYPTVIEQRWMSYTEMKRKIKFFGAPIMLSVEASSGFLCYLIADEAEYKV